MTTEAQMEKKACDKLREEYGAVCIKLGSLYDRSWPDRSINLPEGAHFYIEFKMPGKLLTPLQAHNANLLRDNGHAVYVCRSVDEAIWSAEHFTQTQMIETPMTVFVTAGIDWRRDAIPRRDIVSAGITINELAHIKWLTVT